MKEYKLSREKVADYMRITREALQSGHINDDFIRDELTYQLIGFVYSAAKETGQLHKTIEIERPTFLDWLLRRKKYIGVSIDYELSHLVKVKDLPTNDTLVIIRNTDQS